MHNWLEGVLQHHFRFRWGFVVLSKEQASNVKRRGREMEVGRANKRGMFENSHGNAVSGESEGSESGIDQDDEVGDYGDAELGEGVQGGLFTQVDIDLFCSRMLDIVVPKGVSKMPSNLGEAKHGSLRAAQWYSLFAFIIPLVIMELYVDDVEKLDPKTNRGKILHTIGYLVQCTNLVFSRRVSEWEAQNFELCYKRYHKTSKEIFGDLALKPNHHYALHIPDQLRRWGPLGQVAEFAGERMIGFLQKIQTNTKLGTCMAGIMKRVDGC